MKFINFMKKNKFLALFLFILLVFIIFILYVLSKFVINNNIDEYGTRLDGIENVAIRDESIDKLKDELGKDEKIDEITYKLQGRLINIIIVIKDGVSIDDAKALGNNVLNYFDDEEKAYYDIQVFLKNENKENTEYPIIGYKHKTSETIVWD